MKPIEKIDLNKLIETHFGHMVSYDEMEEGDLEGFAKDIWDKAVDECKKAAKIKLIEGKFIGETPTMWDVEVDKNSIEQVKQTV